MRSDGNRLIGVLQGGDEPAGPKEKVNRSNNAVGSLGQV